MPETRYADCTGRLVQLLPPGPELDEMLGLVRLGVAFRSQQRGRRPGFLHRHIADAVQGLPAHATFESLLEELELQAVRRDRGEDAMPVEKVNRVWQLVTYHCPRKGRQQVTFKTLRNIFTSCKKGLIPEGR
jgi:hypothetical protein